MDLRKSHYMLMVLMCISPTPNYADINTHFNEIKSDPSALYAFFKDMPKGGELHYHFTGAAYPETMLIQSAQGNYCIDPTSFEASKKTGLCTGITTKELLENQSLYDKAIRAWSMKDFHPGQESGHDHFFSAFAKFGPIPQDYHVQLMTEILNRAANQHVMYLEIMAFSLKSASEYAKLISSAQSLAEKKQILLGNELFQNGIKTIIEQSQSYLSDTHHALGCDKIPQTSACSVAVKFQCFVKRGNPLDSVFAQALACFAASAQSKNIVAVNLVEAEDSLTALRDYNAQMQIFEFLHAEYPTVHIVLHAGELEPQAVQPESLRFHIHNAIFIGHAERIGHGVSIASEDNSADLLKYMAQKPIVVETTLTSNRDILNIFGKKHPVNFYIKNHVPVVLSTDDEGILRTDITREYVEAALVQHLDYPTIKMLNRNGLTYSFLPGKSLWQDPLRSKIDPACANLESTECSRFIDKNEKARLQWVLENQLLEFEKKYK